MNCYLDGKFSIQVNPKDGFVLLDCENVKGCRILEFLVPILYPKKGNQGHHNDGK